MLNTIALSVLGAGLVAAQGEGLGYPPPAPVLLTSTKSGVLPVLPTATPFTGIETLEGALLDKGPANPAFQPLLGPASTVSNLPLATYVATLPSTNFNNGTGSTVLGSITISSKPGVAGVVVTLNVTGFPNVTQYGTFGYHIHNVAVPASGNCIDTLGHFDPTNRGEYYPCNVNNTATCQVGDLAGKHGKINGTSSSKSYTDSFLSTDPSSSQFFGDKSIVFHTANTTRLTCANFKLVAGNSSTGGGSSSGSAPYKGAANKIGAAGGLMGVLALVAGLIM